MKARSRATVCLLWFFVLAYSAFIFWLSSKSDPLPAAEPVPVGDKGYHFILYLFYGVFIFLAMAITWPRVPHSHMLVFALGFLILFAITDELHQAFVANREPSVLDIVADGLGGFVGTILTKWRCGTHD